MKASPGDEIARLGRLCGISPAYWDLQGRRHPTSLATYQALLSAMEVPWEDPARRREEIARREAAAHDRLLPPVALVSPRWRRPRLLLAVRLSGSEVTPGLAASGELVAADGSRLAFATRLRAAGPLHRRQVPGGRRAILALPLPPDLTPGYYDLKVEVTGLGRPERAQARLIHAPRTAFLPEFLTPTRRLFGLNLPLYALRSETDWGLGGFGELRAAMAWAAELGAAFVGVNPLHAPLPEAGHDPSPYSPATRLFPNFLYVDLTQVPELAHCPAAQAFLASPEGVNLLAELRSSGQVDYPRVYAFKKRLLWELYQVFDQRHGGASPKSDRGRAWQEFLAAEGPLLRDFALYAALAERHGSGDWRRWPAAFQDKEGREVQTFAAHHPERLRFWQYVLWLAMVQLAKVREQARTAGLPFTLYQDLALGAAAGGFETWAFPRLFAHGAAAGAPPDAFNPKGQDWGLPPFIPERMPETGFDLFIRTLRANLPPGGMLRLDHVMGLFRLFWVPHQRGRAGTYVRYPAPELLAILALESHRARTLIIGEDLGTVAPAIRRELARRRIFSYKVFIFERHGDGRFRTPAEYPPQALAAVTTHDLPTLAGWWQGEDIALKKRFHLYPRANLAEIEAEARQRDRHQLLAALAQEGILYREDCAALAAHPELPLQVREGVLEYLGRSQSALMEVRLEEVFGLTFQQNLPGTVDEHPNWRQKFPLTLAAMRRAPEAQCLARRLAVLRGREGKTAAGAKGP